MDLSRDLKRKRKLYGHLLCNSQFSSRLQTVAVCSVYRQIGEKYGVEYSEAQILNRYRRAYEQPWGRSRLRYVNDGRPFWQYIVSSSTGCSDSQYFEELYNYYTTEKLAWFAALIEPEEDAVHVGDDHRNDIWGATDTGCDAWRWNDIWNSWSP
ncbi:hypothetical protein ACSBR1_035546 [Camellia fascicularis]